MTRISSYRRSVVWPLGYGLAAAIVPVVSADVLMYELRDLGTLGGDVAALGMNDTGMVVGWSETTGGEQHAFQWTQGQGMVDLGTLGGGWAEARAVNNLGQIVGASVGPDGEMRAAYWLDGVLYDLNELLPPGPGFERFSGAIDLRGDGGPPGLSAGGAPSFVLLTRAMAINDSGTIVGSGLVQGDEEPHGFIMLAAGAGPGLEYTCTDLGSLPGSTGSVPYDVNAFDEVVGTSGGHAFLWARGQMTPLDEILRTVVFESQANAIADNGAVAGWYLENWPQRACTWYGGQRMDLNFLPGYITEASAINDGGLTVGWAEMVAAEPFAGRHAVLWEGRSAFDLNDVTAIPLRHNPGQFPGFPWSWLEEATAIDNANRIAGYGRTTDGRMRGFVLTPISVPSAGK